MTTDKATFCACGRPLHYTNEEIQQQVQRLIDRLGPNVTVVVDGDSWLVQRHYIALHGLKSEELPELGFPKVKNG